MNIGMQRFGQEHALESRGGRIAGVVTGTVTNNRDPEGLGRVKVRFDWLEKSVESAWARVATPMAGNDRGTYFLPDVDDEVLVLFAQGDLRFPYVIGGLWNGRDKAPVDNADGKNNVRMIRSRSGHVIKLNDENGKETLEITDASGNSIVFDTSSNTITIRADKDIVLAAPQGTIKLAAKAIDIESSGEGKLAAGASMKVQAGVDLNLKGQIVNIN